MSSNQCSSLRYSSNYNISYIFDIALLNVQWHIIIIKAITSIQTIKSESLMTGNQCGRSSYTKISRRTIKFKEISRISRSCRHPVLLWYHIFPLKQYLPSEWSETGGYTVFTFLSVCVCVHSFEWAESRIVCREMYSTRAWKVENISVRTIYCWNLCFISDDIVRFKIEVGVEIEKCAKINTVSDILALSQQQAVTTRGEVIMLS